MPTAVDDRPTRSRRDLLVIGSLLVTVLLLVVTVGGGCRPADPRLRPPTEAQRASTTVPTTAPPSVDTVPPTDPSESTASTTDPSESTASTTDPGPTAPGESAPTTTPATTPSTAPTTGVPTEVTLPEGPTTVAHARKGLDRIDVYAGPEVPAPTATVPNPGEYGNDQVFVVLEQRDDGWLHVLLPVRPNGSTGWIRESEVDLFVHDYRIDVNLSSFRMRVRDGDDVVLEAPIGVGTSDTPTPAATYYTWVLIAPTNSGYGEYAYGLSGFSEVLDEFAGGNARLGIHGTDDESTIGTNVSHGCIRIHDETVIKMVEELRLPLGVPVSVTA